MGLELEPEQDVGDGGVRHGAHRARRAGDPKVVRAKPRQNPVPAFLRS